MGFFRDEDKSNMADYVCNVNTYKHGGFYWERRLYQSEAFLSLSKNAIKVIIALLDSRVKGKSGSCKNGDKPAHVFTNLNNMILPYGLLEKTYKISRSKIPDALDQVLERGFITIKHQGGMFDHDKSIYAWSDKWQMWKPGVVFFERKQDAVKRGFQRHAK